jgi:hypothetical protein
MMSAVSQPLDRAPLPANYLSHFSSNASLEVPQNASALYGSGGGWSVQAGSEAAGVYHNFQLGMSHDRGDNIDDIDMPFGFNSSAVEGIGCESESRGK